MTLIYVDMCSAFVCLLSKCRCNGCSDKGGNLVLDDHISNFVELCAM